MEVSLPPGQETELNELARESVADRQRLVLKQVQVGIDQIARGEFIEEEEMDILVERMLRD
jgi:predicted transcriptional regulator